MINGVIQTPLKKIPDERGKIMHMLRSTDSHFETFGEIYFSWINPNALKAWHMHQEMSVNLAVPMGSVKIVMYDDRIESATFGKINEFLLDSENNYTLLTIPNKIWYGFKSVSSTPSMIANCSTMPHDSNEIIRINYNTPIIPYNWDDEHA